MSLTLIHNKTGLNLVVKGAEGKTVGIRHNSTAHLPKELVEKLSRMYTGIEVIQPAVVAEEAPKVEDKAEKSKSKAK